MVLFSVVTTCVSIILLLRAHRVECVSSVTQHARLATLANVPSAHQLCFARENAKSKTGEVGAMDGSAEYGLMQNKVRQVAKRSVHRQLNHATSNSQKKVVMRSIFVAPTSWTS